LIYVLLLVLVTAVWGWTFVLVKDAISHYPTLPFLAVRFALAGLVMVLVVHRPPGWRVVRVGVPIGLALAAGYFLQTVGLQTTSPGNAGLLTGLLVLFTPLIDGVLGVRIPPRTVVSAVIALAGTVLLTGSGFALPGIGDVDAEFFFLDDERNPLTLAFRLGIDGMSALNPSARKSLPARSSSSSSKRS